MKTTRSVSEAAINRMGMWKYALLLLMLLTLLLQAIPTFYGDVPALGVHAKRGDETSLSVVKNMLTDKGIPFREAMTEGEEVIVTFDDIDAQQSAKHVLNESLSNYADITIQYQSAAPAWFSTFGAEPVKLGLDLRGGVQLLLFVDLDAVYSKQADSMVNDLRRALREERIRGVTVRKMSSTELKVSGTANPAFWDHFLVSYSGQWETVHEGETFTIQLTEEELMLQAQSAMTQNISILRSRIGELGIVEASVVRQGRDYIRIELPGVHDPKQAKSVIGATASLAFYEATPAGANAIPDRNGALVRLSRQPVLSGDHIVDARASMDEMGLPQVDIRLDGNGGSQMMNFSRHHIGQAMATVYTEYKLSQNGELEPHDQVINVATIQSTLGNSFRITGLDNSAEAQELSLLLRSGALTAPIQIVEERAIGPTLGAQNIKAGFSALALGMIGMAVFMTLWYRRFGWVAIVGLCANLIMQVGLLVLLPGAVLTLPGIAGLVLTVGMAVDTNVLIFERIRDRLREGASLATFIDFGYRSAFVTIFDANITTLISALCLYGIGSGPLQGFATTLILGLITSMVCGIWGTRAIINPIWGRDNRRAVRI
ncbi:protein translocase subunit SecD [Enterovibrio nigricans]|uniref:Protein translocase subunit SecD n=1 Tax=Enterovibrio nigricans DSM 22720 TaxID=1121868 RepID=A0A1T4VG63_9GAMM|nr:protein translocase subunit SecD [Enterovibrio nigricans]PKF49832.1 protein translocase subunit SecD [Enterovibrio nigricans]SKA63521.1 preprotein translocase subunit SecD [Enterovibrio nigricans DSM 22720]